VYRWVTRNPNIGTTIPSMTDIEQVAENIRAGSSPFTPADAKLLAEHRELIRPYYCSMCGKCDGACQKGLQVADMLRFVTYADGYGQFALGRERFLEMSPEHTAVRCADCSECTVKCPHGVHVVAQLKRGQELFGC
jgi:predicted aldo/keto reductase-like oxidoreductase